MMPAMSATTMLAMKFLAVKKECLCSTTDVRKPEGLNPRSSKINLLEYLARNYDEIKLEVTENGKSEE